MDRKRRTEILIKGDRKLSKDISEFIKQKYKVKIISSANQALVMVKARESAMQSLFFLGEVLVTEAKVQIDGATGIGLVKGFDENLAYDLAVIDSAFKANLIEKDLWEERLCNEEVKIKQYELKEEQRILKTKVDFSTMDVEY